MTETMTRGGREARPTQRDRVLQYIKDFGEITQKQAYEDLGVGHLPRRIADLKERGVRIETEMRTGKNRYGEATHFAVYRIAEHKED